MQGREEAGSSKTWGMGPTQMRDPIENASGVDNDVESIFARPIVA